MVSNSDENDSQKSAGLKESMARDPLNMGEKIRELRKINGVTIKELANRIGRSIGYISQIERGISVLSIAALQEIASALNVHINWFFHANDHVQGDEYGFVVRKENRRRLDFLGSRITEELLSPHLNGKLGLLLCTVEPGGSTGEKDRMRYGEEAGYVVEGSIELWVADKHVTLNAGDSFAFTREGPHRCVNSSDKKAVMVWVMTPPTY